MKTKKHFKRLKKSEFDYIKGLISQGYTFQELGVKTGRSESTLHYISVANSLEEYLERNRQMRNKTADMPKDEPELTSSNNIEPNLDSKLAKLDALFDELKQAVVEVAEVMAEQKIAEYKREKEEEVADMKEVVEAAKHSSIAGMLKNKWLGQ